MSGTKTPLEGSSSLRLSLGHFTSCTDLRRSSQWHLLDSLTLLTQPHYNWSERLLP